MSARISKGILALHQDLQAKFPILLSTDLSVLGEHKHWSLRNSLSALLTCDYKCRHLSAINSNNSSVTWTNKCSAISPACDGEANTMWISKLDKRWNIFLVAVDTLSKHHWKMETSSYTHLYNWLHFIYKIHCHKNASSHENKLLKPQQCSLTTCQNRKLVLSKFVLSTTLYYNPAI